MSDQMRLLPREVLPQAERRAWSRRHPVRTALGRALLLTPCFALVVLLAPGLGWPTRFVTVAVIAGAAFAAGWCAIRFQWSERIASVRRPHWPLG